ncbi:hypothetical protein H0H92_000352 [Tricholoma furcatifolium]|nr:hypothetical protein H0H92_000352 [Tricholoma furcatifolium]
MSLPYRHRTEFSELNVDRSKLRIITAEELSRHASEYDCWIAIHGLVYNVTKMTSSEDAYDHYGLCSGTVALFEGLELAGTDCTQWFEDVAHSFSARYDLGRRIPIVGKLASPETVQSPPSHEEESRKTDLAHLKRWWSQIAERENKISQSSGWEPNAVKAEHTKRERLSEFSAAAPGISNFRDEDFRDKDLRDENRSRSLEADSLEGEILLVISDRLSSLTWSVLRD